MILRTSIYRPFIFCIEVKQKEGLHQQHKLRLKALVSLESTYWAQFTIFFPIVLKYVRFTLTLQIVNSALTFSSLDCGWGFVNSEWLPNLYWGSEKESGTEEPDPAQLFKLSSFCPSRICVVLYCRDMQYCIIMRTAYFSTNFLYYVVQLSGILILSYT